MRFHNCARRAGRAFVVVMLPLVSLSTSKLDRLGSKAIAGIRFSLLLGPKLGQGASLYGLSGFGFNARHTAASIGKAVRPAGDDPAHPTFSLSPSRGSCASARRNFR